MKLVTVCVALLLTISLLFNSGCTALTQSSATAKLAVEYATLKVIENSAPEARAARRAKINQIAKDAKTFVSGQSVTLALLDAAIRKNVDFSKLSPADALLANALIDAVIQELQTRVGTGLLDPAQVLAVNAVLDWVIEATAV